MVTSGQEEIASKMGPWNYVGSNSLRTENYVPDITVTCKKNVRVFRMKGSDYRAVRQANEVGLQACLSQLNMWISFWLRGDLLYACMLNGLIHLSIN